MSDYTIPGFTTLGDFDITQERYDLAGVALLLIKGGELFTLYATGCGCGSHSYCSCAMDESLVPENAELVTDLLATAKSLYEDVVNSDSPDVPRLRAALVLAIEATGYSAPMPELEG